VQSSQSNSKAIRIGALLFGVAFSSIGLIILLSIYGYLPSKQEIPFSAKIMTTLSAGVFVFAGMGMVLFSAGTTRLAAQAGGLSLLFFLLTFNWIAFGPGDRNFNRKIRSDLTGTSVTKVSQIEGRIVFGLVAGLMDLLLIYGLILAKQHKT